MVINININENTQVGGSGVSTEAVQGSSIESVQSTQSEKTTKALTTYVATQAIQPMISSVKTAVSTNIGLITGNLELQEKVNFAMSAAQSVGTIASFTTQGAALGGVYGAIAGFALGVGIEAYKIAENVVSNNIDQRLENYQLQTLKDRQGVAYNKSRS